MADFEVPAQPELKDPSQMTPDEIAAESAAIDSMRGSIEMESSPNLLSPTELAQASTEFQEEQKYADRPVAAGAAALASGLSFSLSDRALIKSGLVDEETLAGLSKHNPSVDMLGQVAGAVLPAVLTGGASAPESAAAIGIRGAIKGAAKTALKATPGALIDAAGQATERAALKALGAAAGSGNKKLVAEIIKKSIAKGAGSAVEGAAFGANQLLREDAIGKAELNAENFIDYMGEGALAGGGIGAALVPGGVILKEAGGGLSTALKKVGEKVTNGREDVVKFFGLAPKAIAKQEQIFQAGGEDFKQALLDWTRKNIITDAKSLTKNLDNVGDDLGRIQESAKSRMDEAINEVDSIIGKDAHLSPEVFEDIAKQLEDEFVTPHLGANEELMGPHIEKVREIQRMLRARAKGTPPKPNVNVGAWQAADDEVGALQGQQQQLQAQLAKHEEAGASKVSQVEAAAEQETAHAGAAISSEARQAELAAQIESHNTTLQTVQQKMQAHADEVAAHEAAAGAAKQTEINATEQARILAQEAKIAKANKAPDATQKLELAHEAERARIQASANYARVKAAGPELRKMGAPLQAEFNAAKKAADKVAKQLDAEAQAGQGAARKSEEARMARLEAELNNGDYYEVRQKLRNQLDDLKPRLGAAEEKLQVQKAKLGNEIDTWRAEVDAYKNRPIAAKELRQLRIFLDEQASKFYKSGDEKSVAYAAYKARDGVNKALQNVFSNSKNPELARKWKAANRDYQFTKILEKSTDAKAARANQAFNLKDLVLGGVGAELFGGAGVTLAAANKFANSDLKRKMVILAQVEKAAQKAKAKTESAISDFFAKSSKPSRLLSTGLLTRTALSNNEGGGKPKDRKVAFTNLQNNVAALAADPLKLRDRAVKSTHIMGYAAPQTAQAMQATMGRAVQFLARKMPKDARDSHFDTFSPKYEPSSVELSKFERYLQVVEQPLSVLEDLKSGSLTRDHVEALKAVYPNIYNEIRVAALKQSQTTDNLTYSKRIQLGILLDIPTDASLSPQFILQMQQNFVPPEERQDQMQANGVPAQGGQQPLVNPTAGGAQSVDKTSRQMTQTQRVASGSDA